MALNLTDRLAVRRVVIDRCTAAVVSYAIYILANVAATQPQIAWAREALRLPAEWGDRTSWYVVANSNFIASGSAITDSDIEYIVQTTINTHFIAAP
jgi:hypothetical protein